MKVTLKDKTVLDAVNVEETWHSSNEQGTLLSIHMDSEKSVEELRGIFRPEAFGCVTIENDGGQTYTVEGYTRVDSIRRLYDGKMNFNTAVDLAR